MSDSSSAGLPTASRWRSGHDQALHGAHIDASRKVIGETMNTIIYIVGLVVIVGFILSYFGFR